MILNNIAHHSKVVLDVVIIFNCIHDQKLNPTTFRWIFNILYLFVIIKKRYLICNSEGTVLRRLPSMSQEMAENYTEVRYVNVMIQRYKSHNGT